MGNRILLKKKIWAQGSTCAEWLRRDMRGGVKLPTISNVACQAVALAKAGDWVQNFFEIASNLTSLKD
jgi:hypothetical protein